MFGAEDPDGVTAEDFEPEDPDGDDVPNPPYDPPVGTTWAEWHDA